jgi:plastocyanin
MRRYFAGIVGLSLVLAGCGKDDTKTSSPTTEAGNPTAGKPGKGSDTSSETTKPAGWGSVKGQVVFVGDPPKPTELKVDKDQDTCHHEGGAPLLDQKYVVNKDTKGVQYAVVWLAAAKGKLPIKPELKEVSPKTIELDQPDCQFKPHVMGLRVGQELVAKNPAKISHNTKLECRPLGPDKNELIAAGKELVVPAADFHAGTVVNVSCTIHGWMKGYIRVFDHPYFKVTDEKGNFEIKDAPAGTWKLIVWQEEKGWVNGKDGQEITIKPGDTTDAGKIDLKP